MPAARCRGARRLDPASDYAQSAAALDFGDEANDGVSANVAAFQRIVEDPTVVPPKSHKAALEGEEADADAKTPRRNYPKSA